MTIKERTIVEVDKNDMETLCQAEKLLCNIYCSAAMAEKADLKSQAGELYRKFTLFRINFVEVSSNTST